MLFRGIVNFRAKLSAEGRLSRPIHTSAALPAASGNSGTGGTLSLTLSYLSLLCAEPALVLGIVTVLSCLSGLPFFFHLKIVRHHGRWTLFHMSTGRDFLYPSVPEASAVHGSKILFIPLTIKCIPEASHDLLICIPVPDRSIPTNLALALRGFSARMRLILPAASGSLATIYR